MAREAFTLLDVAVVGGGPAGLSACLALAKSGRLKVALFESQAEPGGMPKTCHFGFGMRDRKRFYRGRAYAEKLTRSVRESEIEIFTDATVVNIIPGSQEQLHGIEVATKDGFKLFKTRFIVLATGCHENSRAGRDIPGKRPAGIYTTGTLQQMVNAQQLKPGLRALIIGSEHVALSCALTLRRAGTKIAGMVEQDPELHTYAIAAKALSLFLKFPIFTHTVVEDILGNERVEGVNLITDGTGKSFFLDCDTVIITGKFRPVTLLIDQTAIEQDPLSGGPVVDTNLMTSVERIFAAGNILRGADMNDLCALEGTRAARRILEMAESTLPEKGRPITLGAEPPIRYVVPQCILPDGRSSATWPWFSPGVSIQLARTLRNPVVEAWSGSEKIWEGSYSKINANTRTVLPLKKFKWNRVDPGQKIVLKIRRADNQPF